MRFLHEMRELPESRKLMMTYAVAAVIWIAFIFFALKLSDSEQLVRANLNSGDQIINSAMVYRSSGGAKRTETQAAAGEPLNVVSEIVNTLGLRERMMQLQSNSTGITMQFEKLYGDELRDFLMTLDSRGIKIKTAELRALPSANERLISITLLLEQG